ncbi:MAG: hypothetical protein ACXIUM_07295 [Wenzhouxiangella sp.]
MAVRIQVVLDEAERAEFRRHARLEGQSLSAWLKTAGRARIAEKQNQRPFTDPESLACFFKQCDERSGSGTEPDWAEHRRLVEESKIRGLPTA